MKKITMILSAMLAMSMTTSMTTHARQHDMGTLRYDVNLDGRVDGIDASMVLTEYASISVGNERSFTSTQRWLADTNYDGMVTAVDASNILTRYAYNSSHEKQMPVVTLTFNAYCIPKGEVGTEIKPMNYEAYNIEDVYHFIECSRDSYPETAKFVISINETIWDKPITQSDILCDMEDSY